MQLVGVLEGIHLQSRNVELEDERDSLHSFKEISTARSVSLSLCLALSLVFFSCLCRWEAAFYARLIHYLFLRIWTSARGGAVC